MAGLHGILHPPEVAVECKGGGAENLDLPEDYVQFVRTYGTGMIAGFIFIFNVFSKREDYNLYVQRDLIVSDFQSLSDYDAAVYRFSLYPQQGGLYPLGVTANGDCLFWRTQGQPADWTIAVIASRSSEVEDTPYNLTSFLSRLLTKRLRLAAFPASFPSGAVSFTPL